MNPIDKIAATIGSFVGLAIAQIPMQSVYPGEPLIIALLLLLLCILCVIGSGELFYHSTKYIRQKINYANIR